MHAMMPKRQFMLVLGYLLFVCVACASELETAVSPTPQPATVTTLPTATGLSSTPFSAISAATATNLPENTAVVPGTVVTSPTITATSTATQTPTPIPTAINFTVTPTATVNATGNEEWVIYRNGSYGFEFSYPSTAHITAIGADDFPDEELPPNVTPAEYLEHLQELYPEGACVGVEYNSSFITFRVPLDKGGKYVSGCGVTGIGDYDSVEKFETVSINGQPVMVSGLELHERNATAAIVDEFWGVLLDDGTGIQYGNYAGAMYEGFLEDKETILQILASFRTGLEACTNDSQFLLDVTVPDGTHFTPNTRFTKTWRLLNIGGCSWDSGYHIQFFPGGEMQDPARLVLSETVPPGGEVDISVEFKAPGSVGTYRVQWQLAAPDGTLFGAKPYVEIIVP